METITISKEDLKSLLTNVYNNGSISTENFIEENPGKEFPLTKKSREFVDIVVSGLKFR